MKLILTSMEKNHSNPRRYRSSYERARGIGFMLNTVLAVLILLCAYQPQALAQDLLSDDGNTHKFDVLPGQDIRDGVAWTYKIYSNTSYTALSFTIRGGDGGRARADRSSCAEYGGDGAVINMTIPIGNGSGEIPPGSEIRFFVGKAGEQDYGSGPSTRYGGGGSAVTARLPGKTGISDWIILAAAGGGGVAEVKFDSFEGCVTEIAGQGGRDFNWDRSDVGDGGDPGGKNDKAGGGGKDGGTFHGGGGYTGGNAKQGGGSWANTKYDSNATLIAGGSTEPTDNGYIEYQFKEICSINSVATTAATCIANGSATINVTTACANKFTYGVEDSSGNLKTSNGTNFSGLAAGTYTAYIWRGEFFDGVSGEYQFTIPEGTCDTTAPVITLNDNNPMYIGQGGTYSEPGATATDDIDGDITNNITIGGDAVDVNTAGTYKVTYNVSDQAGNNAVQVERTVIVDLAVPVITLNGDNPMYIGQGGTYSEPGAAATDETDGDISGKIVIGGDVVDVNTAGTYKVTYDVSDQVGNAAVQVERTVIVDLSVPVITLNGDNPIYIGQGGTYSEPGATATDDIDGDITNKIKIGGDAVDVTTAGTYKVTYNVSDQAGNAAVQVERTIIVDLSGPVITLNGDNPMYIGQGGSYSEPGATATDDIDGTITDKIVIGPSAVNASTAGTYKVTYSVSDQSGNTTIVDRTVIVDLSVPVITLNGDDPMLIVHGSAYVEPGASAMDDIDGDITDNIVIDGDVIDASTVGTYTVTYNVSDQAGNASNEVKRTVIVDSSNVLSIKSFVLVDADEDKDIIEIKNGMVINLPDYGLSKNTSSRETSTKLNICMKTGNDVESVKMELSGAQSQTTIANRLSYSLYGDTEGDYRGSRLAIGKYYLTLRTVWAVTRVLQ